METLKGIFPQTQPPPKRDFLKENVMKIRNMQRMRKPTNSQTEYSKYNKQVKNRKFSLSENNALTAHRSTNSLALCSTKAPISNLRKSVSSMSIQSQKREFGTQTVDPNEDFFLKDSIIRYPSASTLRSSSTVRPPSAHHTQTCSRGHQMEPDSDPPPRPRFRSHFSDRGDEHCEKMERHISNLSEFLDRGSISKKDKQPASILKNPSTASSQKSNKNLINESQRSGKEQSIEISDDEEEKEVVSEKKQREEKQLKAAEEDPNCPEGHVPLPEHERLEALKIAQKRFKDLVDDLNRLPMTCETLRVRNRKIEIEKELRGLEINIRVFSRNKVYVKLHGD